MHSPNVGFEGRIGSSTKRIVKVGGRLYYYGVETVLCLQEGTGNVAGYTW